MIQSLLSYPDAGLILLRVVLGIILVVHGWPKIRDLRGNAEDFEMMKYKPGVLWGTLVAFLEFGGGLMLVFGLFTQLIALFVAIQFVFIILRMKRTDGFVDGYEFDLLIAAAACALAFMGGGTWGLDGFLIL